MVKDKGVGIARERGINWALFSLHINTKFDIIFKTTEVDHEDV